MRLVDECYQRAIDVLKGEEVRPSIKFIIKRLIKVGAKVAAHGRQWQVHLASAFPLAGHYEAVFWMNIGAYQSVDQIAMGELCSTSVIQPSGRGET